MDPETGNQLMDSIRCIGMRALSITAGSMTICGDRFFMQRYSFSMVLSFIYGQSLHAQFASGGAGMKRFPGAAFSIW